MNGGNRACGGWPAIWAGRRRLAHAAGLLACGLLSAGCGISALVPDRNMPAEQVASIAVQRVVLFPLTGGSSEVALAVAAVQASRREAVLAGAGGLAAPAGRGGAEAAYQDQIRPSLDLGDPFTRFVLATRLWLAGEVDAGRMTEAQAQEVLGHIRAEVSVLRARRENFAPASVHLRRTLWAVAPGTTLGSLQRESELYRRYRIECPTERSWGTVQSFC